MLGYSSGTITHLDEWTAGGNAYGGAWSPDNIHVCAGHYLSSYFTILKFEGGMFTKMADYDLGGFGLVGAFNGDGSLVASGCYYAPQIRLFSWDGVDTLQELANYEVGSAVWGADFL